AKVSLFTQKPNLVLYSGCCSNTVVPYAPLKGIPCNSSVCLFNAAICVLSKVVFNQHSFSSRYCKVKLSPASYNAISSIFPHFFKLIKYVKLPNFQPKE